MVICWDPVFLCLLPTTAIRNQCVKDTWVLNPANDLCRKKCVCDPPALSDVKMLQKHELQFFLLAFSNLTNIRNTNFDLP